MQGKANKPNEPDNLAYAIMDDIIRPTIPPQGRRVHLEISDAGIRRPRCIDGLKS